MRREEIEDGLPLILRHYEEVVKRLERATTKAAATRKASRRDILNGYLLTRSVTKTARDLRVSDTLVSSVLARAVFAARRIETPSH